MFVSADSLAGRVPTCSAVALVGRPEFKSQITNLSRSYSPFSPTSLPIHLLSINKGNKTQKKSKNKIK